MEPVDVLAIFNNEKGYNISSESVNQNVPPLQKFLLSGSIENIEKELENIYEIKLSSHNDWSQKCLEIVDVCIERNLAVNLSEKNKYSTLLHFVIKNLYNDFHSIIKRLTNFDINARNDGFLYDCKTLLHLAIQEGRQNVVKILLEFGADVNVQSYHGNTPLFEAVETTQLKVAEMLLKAGANVNAKTDFGLTPIHYAFGQPGFGYDFNYGQKLPYWELIELLRAYGAELNFKNAAGGEALCDACRGGDVKEVQFLLDHGADLSVTRDSQDYTPLHYAVLGNSVSFVDFLLNNGADLKSISLDENSPILKLADVIYINCQILDVDPFIAPQLFDYGDFPIGDLEMTVQGLKMAVDMIEYLVDNGASVNIFNDSENSPLSVSISVNSVETVECFLELKVDIDNEMNYRYLFSYHYYITQSKNLYSDRPDACVVLTAFLATKKDDISDYVDSYYGRTQFDWVLPFFAQCKIEVNQMKKRSICENRSVTFFDFLTQDLMKVLLFCRCDEIMSVLVSRKHEQEFRCYKYLFEKRLERVKKLKECEKDFVQCLKKYFKRSLPFVVVNEIFSNLSAADLRNFGRALHLSKDCTGGKLLHLRCLL